jgi:5-methylcytosine-specific restriction endonuclease McrA
LTVVTLARAVKLLLRGRAEAVSDERITVASAAETLAVPQVLRLKIYAHVPRRRTPLWTRRGVFERDDFTCAYCGRRYAARDLTVDHLIPVSQGGASTWGNTVAACPRCNQRKADRTPHEAGMKLLVEPKAPRTSYLVASGDVPAAWKVWIEL